MGRMKISKNIHIRMPLEFLLKQPQNTTTSDWLRGLIYEAQEAREKETPNKLEQFHQEQVNENKWNKTDSKI